MKYIYTAIEDFKGVIKKAFYRFHKFDSRKVLSALLAVLIVIFSFLVGSRASMAKTSTDDLTEENHDSGIVCEDVIDPIQFEAEYVAKVLYGTAQYNTERGQKMVVWCIVNRVENPNYPNTIEEVCRQKDQWMGYSDNNPILQDLFDISYETLYYWHNGGYRYVGPDFLFVKWYPDQIVLKTDFEEGRNCHYFYE